MVPVVTDTLTPAITGNVVQDRWIAGGEFVYLLNDCHGTGRSKRNQGATPAEARCGPSWSDAAWGIGRAGWECTCWPAAANDAASDSSEPDGGRS